MEHEVACDPGFEARYGEPRPWLQVEPAPVPDWLAAWYAHLGLTR